MASETPTDNNGLRTYGEIATRYGHTIRVQDSTYADEPRAWLDISASPVSQEGKPLLSKDDAKQLRDALDRFIAEAE